MYDASLDKIYPNRQSFYVNYSRFVPQIYWSYGYTGSVYYSCYFPMRDWKVSPFVYDTFYSEEGVQEALVVGYGVMKNSTMTGSVQVRGLASPRMKEMVAEDSSADAADMIFEEEMVSTEETGAAVELGDAPELRTNFAETAFFYPQLRTNEQGEISFSFTMPQSLTRWNFRGYSHTKGMMIGKLDASTVTVKEFMLSPYLYCTPIKFAAQPDCRPPARYFPASLQIQAVCSIAPHLPWPALGLIYAVLKCTGDIPFGHPGNFFCLREYLRRCPLPPCSDSGF